MDAVAGLLDGPRAREAFLLRSTVDPPWSISIRDEAPLTVMAVVRGEAWLVPGDGEPTCLRDGDVAVLRGPDHYTVADDPASAPQVAVDPGQRCVVLEAAGAALVESMGCGVRTWGNAGAAAGTELLTGTYGAGGEVSHRLLRALPALLVVRREDARSPVVALLAEE